MIRRLGVILVLFAVVLLLFACSILEPGQVEVTRIIEVPAEVTRLVEVPVEVTRLLEVEVTVEVPVEVTRIIEVTRIAEIEAEPTLKPTPEPTASEAQSGSSSQVGDQQLLRSIGNTKQTLMLYGGEIDAALRGDIFSCDNSIAWYQTVSGAPTYSVSGDSQVAAYNLYRSAVDNFVNSTAKDVHNNCLDLMNDPNKDNGTISFIQWGPARQAVNESVDMLHRAEQILGQ